MSQQAKQSIQIPSQSSPSSGSAEAVISRRAALAQSLHFAELAALVLPAAILPWSLSTGDAPSPPSTHYPKTDSLCKFEDGTSFRNLGVKHSEFFLRENSAHLRSAIRSADIVVIECNAELLQNDPFFNRVAGTSLKDGKTVYLIDNQKTSLAAIQLIGSPAASFLGAAGLAYANHVAKKEGEEVPRRSFIKIASRILGWAGYLSSSTTPTSSAATAAGCYPYWDSSFGTDCRTVAMLRDIQDIVRLHPDKMAVSFTGDIHARAFQTYADHPTLTGAKLAAYDFVYNSWLRKPYSLLNAPTP